MHKCQKNLEVLIALNQNFKHMYSIQIAWIPQHVNGDHLLIYCSSDIKSNQDCYLYSLYVISLSTSENHSKWSILNLDLGISMSEGLSSSTSLSSSSASSSFFLSFFYWQMFYVNSKNSKWDMQRANSQWKMDKIRIVAMFSMT